MEIHLLDYLIYFVIIIFLWFYIGIERIGENNGAERFIIFLIVSFLFTIIYILIFYNYNWVDFNKYVNTLFDIKL
jgi:hypothetical protein